MYEGDTKKELLSGPRFSNAFWITNLSGGKKLLMKSMFVHQFCLQRSAVFSTAWGQSGPEPINGIINTRQMIAK